MYNEIDTSGESYETFFAKNLFTIFSKLDLFIAFLQILFTFIKWSSLLKRSVYLLKKFIGSLQRVVDLLKLF